MTIDHNPSASFLFLYRSILPKHYLFYIFFFGIKLIGLFLVTHNISKHEDPLISIEKCLKLLLFFNPSTFPKLNYLTLCIVIYVFFLIHLIGFIFLYVKLSKILKKSTEDIKTWTSRQKTPKWLKTLTKAYSIFYLVLMLLSQHILELLIFVFHIISFNQLNLKGVLTTSNAVKEAITGFNTKLGQYVYAIYTLNGIVICYILMSLYLFVEFSCSRYISIEIGSPEFSNGLTTIILLAVFVLQGIYPASYFDPSAQSYFGFGVNVVAILLCLIFIVIDFKKSSIIFSINPLLKGIYFVLVLCLISGVYEIFLFFFETKALTQFSYFIKINIEMIISVIITFFLFKKKRRRSLDALGVSIFNKNKPKGYINPLFQFSLLLYQLVVNETNDFIELHSILQKHSMNCVDNRDRCPCQHMNIVTLIHSSSSKALKKSQNSKAKDSMNRNPDSFNKHKKVILDNYITICEEEIKAYIYLLHKSKRNEAILQKMIILHCDFLVSIKETPNQAIYTIQQYLNQTKHKLDFTNYYYLFELNRYVIQSIVRVKKIEEHKNRGGREQATNCVNQQTKIRMVMQHLQGLNQINHYIVQFCDLFERVLPPQSHYTSFDVYISKMAALKYDISCLKSILEMSYSLLGPLKQKETCYLLSQFFLLIYKEIPEEVKGMFTFIKNVTEYKDIDEPEKNNPSDSMIINMTPQETFTISYISQRICDELDYEKEALLNNDFHILLPKEIRKSHEKILQLFLNYNNKNVFRYIKETYFLNKSNYIIPLIVKVKKLPTYSQNISLIINANFIKESTKTANSPSTYSDNDKDYYMYHFLLDYHYNIFAISSSVENQFMFSLKMFEDLKINFCFFFNLSQDRLIPKHILSKLNELEPINLTVETEIISIFTNPSLSDMNLVKRSRNIIDMIDKNYCFSFNTLIKKDRVLNDITRFNQRINDYGLDNEFQKYISYLADRLRPLRDDMKPNPNHEVFQATFSAKLMGDYSYYVVVLKEEIDNSVRALNSKKSTITFIKYTPNMQNSTVSPSISSKYLVSNYNDRQWKNESSLKKSEKYLSPHSNSNNALISSNQNITNASNVTVNSISKGGNETMKSTSRVFLAVNQNDNLKKLSLYPKSPQKYSKHKSSLKTKRPLIQVQGNPTKLTLRQFRYSFLLDYSIWLFFIAINCLIVAKTIISSEKLKDEKTFLLIITSIVKLQGEVIFASVEELDNCLYKDGLISLVSFEALLFYGDTGGQLLESVDELTKDIYRLNSHPEAYQLFTNQSEYDVISFDWSKRKRVSTLTEEIHLLHYYLKMVNQESMRDAPCRFSKYFLKQSASPIDPTEEANREEQLVYYLIFNSQFQIKTQLERFKMSMIDILQSELDSKRRMMTAIELSIIGLSLVLFAVTVVKLQIFNRQIRQLLSQLSLIEGKELIEKLKVFKSLIENFELKKCHILDKSYFITFAPVSIREDNDGSKVNAPTANQQNSEKDSSSSTVNQAQPQAGKIGFLFMISWIVIVVAIVLARLFTSLYEYDGMKIFYTISRLFLERVPILCELLFYTETSAFANDPNFIPLNKDALANFLKYSYYSEATTNNSTLYEKFKESYFVLLYYEADLIDRAITKFIYKDKNNAILAKTKAEEISLNTDFCFSLITSFSSKPYYEASSMTDFMSVLNDIAIRCRSIKVNNDSLKLAIKLMISKMESAYTTFWESTDSDKVKNFITDLTYVTRNLRTIMKIVHSNVVSSVNDEFNGFFTRISNEGIIWLCVFVLFCFVLILIILVKLFTYLYSARDMLLTQGNFILTALKREKKTEV